MEGEPKQEMHDLLPPEFAPSTFNVLPKSDFEMVKQKLSEHKIDFPLIVKPEVGGQGILFRKLDTIEQLKDYHEKVPVEYIVQEMITYPMEVSVFYYRMPNESKGVVTGFLHKIPLHVTGDGKQTLYELIKQHPKAYKREAEMQVKHGAYFNTVPGPGEKYMLSYAANHNRGAQFVNLHEQIDDRLVSIFDKISIRLNDFFYGRYDILCASVEDLKQEKNFCILEYNGCGAEPNHFYDTGYTLIGAYKEILMHWKALYKISRYNYKQGIKYWPFMKGYKFLNDTKKLYRVMRQADKSI